ncbi:MAG: hypothetical protein AAF597_04875 [Bacteroidota bacterium]
MTYAEEKKIRRLAMASDSAIIVEVKALSSYRPEMARAIITEAKKRNLSPEIISNYEQSSKFLSETEEAKWVKYISFGCCQHCDKEKELKGFTNRKAVSFLRGTRIDESLEFSCVDCGQLLLKDSSRFSAAFGWWSLTGVFVTPYVLMKNYQELRNEFPNSDNHWKTVVRTNYKSLRKEFPEVLED